MNKDIKNKKAKVLPFTVITLMVLTTISSFMLIIPNTVKATTEDFTTYTATNLTTAEGIFTVTNTNISWTNAKNSNNCHIYKDMGAGSITDFNYSFSFGCSDSDATTSSCGFFGVNENITTYVISTAGDFATISLFYNINGAGDNKVFYLNDASVYGTQDDSLEPYNLQLDFPFTKYIVLSRHIEDGVGYTNATIFNNSDFTGLFAYLNVTGTPNGLRYVYAHLPFGSSDTHENDGFIANLNLDYGGVDLGDFVVADLNADTRFPFIMEANTIEWSDGNVTMSIYTNLSGTTGNCTDIYLDFKTGIDADIDEESFSFAIINTTDGLWATIAGVTVDIPNGGNYTLNATTWATGLAAGWAHGTCPFPIVDSDEVLQVRLTCEVPPGKATGAYTADNFDVVWKVLY